MYQNPIVQNNISKLKDFGYKFIEPASGRLACGDIGIGKLADVNTIVERVIEELEDKEQDLLGKKVLVSAGPTIEPIDPVRYITNRSTGKMGYAIAKEARDRGAEVILVSGPTNLEPPKNVKIINIKTSLYFRLFCRKNPIYLQRNRDRQMFFRFFYLFRHLKSYFIDAAFFHPLFRRVVLCLTSCKENTLEFYV